MAMPEAPDVTRLLLDWRQGQPAALDRLLPLVYSELKKIAHARMRAESRGDQTMQTTALVNEAYVRLVDGARVDWQNRAHFYAVCARLDAPHTGGPRPGAPRGQARRRARRVPFGDWIGAVPAKDDLLLALDEALQRLSASDHRKAQVVELRYFGGLTLDETAVALGTSPETVTRDWKVAKLWLAHESEGVRGGYREAAQERAR